MAQFELHSTANFVSCAGKKSQSQSLELCAIVPLARRGRTARAVRERFSFQIEKAWKVEENNRNHQKQMPASVIFNATSRTEFFAKNNCKKAFDYSIDTFCSSNLAPHFYSTLC